MIMAPVGVRWHGRRALPKNVQNIHIGKGASEADFVAMRTKRDATLAMPTLIMPSIQVNMRAGHMPASEPDGGVYLKVPISGLKPKNNPDPVFSGAR